MIRARRPFLWDGRCRPPRATNPDDDPETGLGPNQFPGGLVSSLFGFAPGGACRAARVTASAVRSYRTLSPLPIRGWAVYFLWRFPWGRPRRTLSGTVSPWSPDFPPPWCPTEAAVQPTGEPHIGAGAVRGQSFNRRNARRRNPFGFRPLARPRARGGFKPGPALANGISCWPSGPGPWRNSCGRPPTCGGRHGRTGSA